jgi:hypothetical protein
VALRALFFVLEGLGQQELEEHNSQQVLQNKRVLELFGQIIHTCLIINKIAQSHLGNISIFYLHQFYPKFTTYKVYIVYLANFIMSKISRNVSKQDLLKVTKFIVILYYYYTATRIFFCEILLAGII